MSPSGGSTSSQNLTKSESLASIGNRSVQQDSGYRTYKRRWFILLVVILLNLSNAMIWITFSPIADLTTVYFKTNAFNVNMLSIVFMIASIPCGFMATWLLDTLGLRISILIAASLNFLGSLLRNVSTFDIPVDAKFPVLMLGQTIAACAQPFVMFAPTKLAALWFPDSQRATANMLASMSNPLGILLANVIVPAIVSGCEESQIPLSLWVITAPSGFVTLMATFGVCSSVPPTPPTASADEASEPFLAGLKKIAKNKNYWVLNVVFGIGLAMFTALSSLLDQILCPRGYTNDFAGMCGALMIGAGVVGAVIAGLFVDKTKMFEEVVKVCFAFGVLSGIAFTQVSRLRNMAIPIATTVGLFGFFGFAIYPISLELSVEITYPVAEATSSGMMVISGQIQGIVYVLLMQFLAQDLPESEKYLETGCTQGCNSTVGSDTGFTPQDWTNPNLGVNIISALGAVFLILFLKGDYKRLKAEEKIMAQRILQTTIEIKVDGTEGNTNVIG